MLSPDVQKLVIEFRQNLESFYQRMQLAPPYHSVEKALSCLTTRLQQHTPEEQHQIASEPTRKWKLFQEAVIESGLNRKHRGIIAGILRSQNPNTVPEDQRYLEQPFLTSL